jgi:hypothetical protein
VRGAAGVDLRRVRREQVGQGAREGFNPNLLFCCFKLFYVVCNQARIKFNIFFPFDVHHHKTQ